MEEIGTLFWSSILVICVQNNKIVQEKIISFFIISSGNFLYYNNILSIQKKKTQKSIQYLFMYLYSWILILY